jgi:uncharacterized protein (DUF305 family)
MHRVLDARAFLAVIAAVLLIAPLMGCGGSSATVGPDEADDDDAHEVAPEPRVVQPGAPGEASRTIDPTRLGSRPAMAYTEAEVRFMQDMMHHHAQAVEMGALVEGRTTNEDIRLVAHRIAVSQEDEMALMRRWLEDRGEHVPDIHPTLAPDDDPHAHHAHHGHETVAAPSAHADMPGMLTPEQMQQLTDASGDEFDRLFLEFMIMHHEGALVMVEHLFSTEGAAQQSDTFSFASHVDSDQRIEILRMRRMLHEMNQPANH